MPEANYFKRFFDLDLSSRIESKNGLSYLSWANAWAEVKKAYPMSYYTIYENPAQMNYFTDGRTCWVKTGVTVVYGEGKELEHIEYLPIMDTRNKSIPLETVTSMDVNKAIQRSLTKAAARHGVGLYIYAGEDVPEAIAEEAAKEEAARKKELTDLHNEIAELGKALIKKGLPRETLFQTVGAYNNGSSNPAGITSPDTCRKLLAALAKHETALTKSAPKKEKEKVLAE